MRILLHRRNNSIYFRRQISITENIHNRDSAQRANHALNGILFFMSLSACSQGYEYGLQFHPGAFSKTVNGFTISLTGAVNGGAK